MSSAHQSAFARDILRREVGVVVPLYVGPGTENAGVLASDTVGAYTALVDNPAHICIAVDGEDRGGDIGREIAGRFGASIVVCPENRGKLQAVRSGICELRKFTELQWIACVDQDGDHFANELLNLLRGALHMRETAERVLVIGGRSSRHRPMGFLRGELEDMADRVLLDALHYHAAQQGQPLHLEYSTALEEFPDFHSGFKLFDRQTALAVADASPQFAESADRYYRHAVEAVLVVEAHLVGAVLGSVNRSTFNEQPVSAFGQLRRTQLVADKIIWPCQRLGVPGHFATQWVDNHLPRLLLATLVPDGADELATIRRIVADAFDQPPAAPGRPLFM